MKYLHLLHILRRLTPKELSCDITIRDSNNEYHLAELKTADTDVLDPGHPVICAIPPTVKVTATVLWPVVVEIEIKEHEVYNVVKDKLLNAAGDILATSTIKPIIKDCSLDTLNS